MAKVYTAIQIGNSSIKMVQVADGVATKMAIETVPDNLVRDGQILSWDAMGELLKKMAKESQIKSRNAAVVLPSQICFLRRTTMPYMTVEQMRLNLPYEFKDYIHVDQEDYIYDYAVIGQQTNEDGEIETLELLTAAVRRDVIAGYSKMLSRVGFKLKIALPEAYTYRNIIRRYEESQKVHPDAYCIVDMGHTAIRIHLYKGSSYDTTRVIEMGGAYLDELIAENLDVDIHVAASYKQKNHQNVQDTEESRELYGKMVVEIFRAINFYNYNNPEGELKDIYFCGGMAKVEALVDMIRSTLETVQCHSISELLPHAGQKESIELVSTAVGATMQ